ncbi:hypothetical protein HMPREF2863_10225 [Micrococcus sp. HMSC067E09]|uniref:hypothetical protein n=1 Tax=Micrococcus sp. HMSC067E09 TaxID=1739367 RepID=UPI0008A2E6AC|nr:hypothetical protein [Micrococcus sp. HMSC067E09]OFR89120.1 hypothetical protein HMPREF2863_10225 [Micrococcus sp. HMSC067E09]
MTSSAATEPAHDDGRFHRQLRPTGPLGIAGAVAVVLSLIGFSDLIGLVYPALGYAGMVIIVLVLARWAMARKDAADVA